MKRLTATDIGSGRLQAAVDLFSSEGEVVLHSSTGDEYALPPEAREFFAAAIAAATNGAAVLFSQEEMVTPAEASRMLGVSRPTVYQWIKDGFLEDRRVGSDHRIPVASLEAFMERRRAAGRRAMQVLQKDPQSPIVQAARARVAARHSQRA